MNNKTVEILFPISLLKNGPDLLDPDNTESIWEYYLLENLTCGLIRDSKYSPTGYQGCIAEDFYQEDPYTWTFRLRPLKWSDGSDVQSLEIEKWIHDIQSSSRRHIRFLKLVKKVEYDENNRILKLHFPFKIDTALLHELSLADSALMPRDYKQNGWNKTIGPYKVQQWSKKENILLLEANVFSPLYREDMPKMAKLSQLIDSSERPQLFKTILVDVVPISAYPNPGAIDQVLKNAPQIFTSRPISIAYFHFNHKNLKTHNLVNRQFFSSVISKIREKIPALSPSTIDWKPESQMIPEGFLGRLDKFKDTEGTETETSHFHELTIRLPTVFKEYTLLVSTIKSVFKNFNIDISINFSDSYEFSNDEFASLYIFLGNQLDPSGSWAFLTTEPYGNLSPWKQEYLNYFAKVFVDVEVESRQLNLNLLHKIILERAIAVPLMIGSQRYFFSDRIDFSRWNFFDSRLRIYDLRWK